MIASAGKPLHASRLAVFAAALFLALLAALTSGDRAAAKTVWLCKPGLADDPCRPGLTTTVFSASGDELRVERPTPKRRIDCFYVYPTVSDQPTPNANRVIDPELRSVALYEAARYSQRCRVFAPVYRQITVAALLGSGETPQMWETAYRDVRAAWRRYLSGHNGGRGVVLIGHSQGTYILRQLIADEIEPRRGVRKRLVSALLLGGNVLVRQGADPDEDFRRIKPCRSARSLRCVIGYSTFNGPVPEDARFGRADIGFPASTDPKVRVLCANPAALGGGAAPLRSVYPSEPFAPGTTIGLATAALGAPRPAVATPWYEFRGAYTGECSGADGANVLQLADAPGAPHLNAVPDATWGLHFVDANIALGDLIRVVGGQARRYLHRTR